MSFMAPDKPMKTDQIAMEDEAVQEALRQMESDSSLNTKANVNSALDLENLPFQEKHMKHLRTHPKVNAANYLSNLRIMLKNRSSK